MLLRKSDVPARMISTRRGVDANRRVFACLLVRFCIHPICRRASARRAAASTLIATFQCAFRLLLRKSDVPARMLPTRRSVDSNRRVFAVPFGRFCMSPMCRRG